MAAKRQAEFSTIDHGHQAWTTKFYTMLAIYMIKLYSNFYIPNITTEIKIPRYAMKNAGKMIEMKDSYPNNCEEASKIGVTIFVKVSNVIYIKCMLYWLL